MYITLSRNVDMQFSTFVLKDLILLFFVQKIITRCEQFQTRTEWPNQQSTVSVSVCEQDYIISLHIIHFEIF